MCCGALSHLPADKTNADQKYCSLGQPRHLPGEAQKPTHHVNQLLRVKNNRGTMTHRQHRWYYGLVNHNLMLEKYPSEQRQQQEQLLSASRQTSVDFWRANRLYWCYTWKAFWDSLLCQYIYLSKGESRKSCATSPVRTGCNSLNCELRMALINLEDSSSLN